MLESELARKRIDYCQDLAAALDDLIYRLREMPEIERVILFGSYAAGRRDLFTDLDVIIVMETEQDFIQRTAALYRLLQTDVDLDLLVYTPDEFEKKRKQGFLRHALETGQIVYEKQRA